MMSMLLVTACANANSVGKYDALQEDLPEATDRLGEALLNCNVPECDESIVAGANLLDLLDQVFD